MKNVLLASFSSTCKAPCRMGPEQRTAGLNMLNALAPCMERSEEAGARTVETYIASFPRDVQNKLRELRGVIKDEAPDAAESIAYGMPAYKLNGRPLVYFAAFAHHIGFYPTPAGIEAFTAELSRYKQGKGSVQFPLDEPLPLDLVRRVVRERLKRPAEGTPKKEGWCYTAASRRSYVYRTRPSDLISARPPLGPYRSGRCCGPRATGRS